MTLFFEHARGSYLSASIFACPLRYLQKEIHDARRAAELLGMRGRGEVAEWTSAECSRDCSPPHLFPIPFAHSVFDISERQSRSSRGFKGKGRGTNRSPLCLNAALKHFEDYFR